jgi:hypothetical protein
MTAKAPPFQDPVNVAVPRQRRRDLRMRRGPTYRRRQQDRGTDQSRPQKASHRHAHHHPVAIVGSPARSC